MDDDSDTIAQAVLRERAVEQLSAALRSCTLTMLTRAEILAEVRPYLTDDGIAVEGTVFEHLRSGETATVLGIFYSALPEGATLSFSETWKSNELIRDLCKDAKIDEDDVTITGDRPAFRLTITKPPS